MILNCSSTQYHYASAHLPISSDCLCGKRNQVRHPTPDGGDADKEEELYEAFIILSISKLRTAYEAAGKFGLCKEGPEDCTLFEWVKGQAPLHFTWQKTSTEEPDLSINFELVTK